MHFIESTFNDFELLQQAAKMWDIDFCLLSKQDFKAYLSLYTVQKFQIGRTKFNGKIHQLGLCPVGFRTITVPAINTSHFIWRNKETYGNQLLIFPQNANLDAVSYDDFEVYIISIEESYLFQTLEYLGYLNAKKFFDGDEKYIDMNDSFVRTFQQKADELINNARFDVTEGAYKNTEVQNFQFDDILILLLRFLENQSHWIKKKPQRRRDVALKKAVDLINNELEVMPTISQLCKYTGVSERTLEYAFIEKFKVTPKDYIKATKLNKIRAELLLTKRKNCKISTIALFHGFWHMGQFAADYKKWFGESPSETLKR